VFEVIVIGAVRPVCRRPCAPASWAPQNGSTTTGPDGSKLRPAPPGFTSRHASALAGLAFSQSSRGDATGVKRDCLKQRFVVLGGMGLERQEVGKRPKAAC